MPPCYAQAGTQNHYPSFFEFDLGHASNLETSLPPAKAQHDSRLWNWHPVIRAKSSGSLKFGHLSDVHVNVRQNTLARSPACVIEGKAEAGSPGEPVGKHLNHCLVALNDLVGQFAGKADALFITGDRSSASAAPSRRLSPAPRA